MDNYKEEIVIKRNRAVNNILHAVLCVLMVLCGLFALLNISQIGFSENLLMTIASALIYGGAAFLIWWKKDMLRLEYEYTFTNGEMDFACVMGNKKRKNLGTMRVKNVEACGMVASGSFHRYISMPGIKKSNWFLNRDGNLFYFFYQKNGEKHIIIIEPTDEMIGMIKLYLPHGVYQTN